MERDMGIDAFRVLSPTAILGYGFPESSFARGMEKKPDLIAVDAGSTDPGPYYLGSGKSFTSRPAVMRDLRIMLKGALNAGVPLIIGSAGGAGARVHVDWTTEIIREIAAENSLRFSMAVIYADIPKSSILKAAFEGGIHSLDSGPEFRPNSIDEAVRVVAQMGLEPVLKALKSGFQVIVCGRCYDPVPFAAPAIQKGYDPGLALHMGKILECAAIAATPGSGRDCVMGTLRAESFELESLSDARRFTRMSTAAHSLYEKSDPWMLPGPGGFLDLSNTVFEEIDDRRARVSGTRFVETRPYTLKLEGVRRVGFRSISIAGIRDPILISQIDATLDSVRQEAVAGRDERFQVLFHLYGRNGVMGPWEPERESPCHELGVVIEAVGPDQQGADWLCAEVRSTLLHCGYSGRKSTAGNLALLYSPSDIACGEVFSFNIYHLMNVEDPLAFFPIHAQEVS